jgi:BetI-type transcriptional repressor, C-terminal
VFAGDSDPAVWLELIAASATDPEVRRVMALDRKVDLRMMRQFLRRLEDRGRIPKMKDPTTTTEIVVTLLEGTVLRLMMGGSTAETRRTLIAELRLVLGL